MKFEIRFKNGEIYLDDYSKGEKKYNITNKEFETFIHDDDYFFKLLHFDYDKNNYAVELI